MASTPAIPYLPQFTVLNGVDVYNPASFTMSSFEIANERTSQRDFGGSMNFTKAHAAGSVPSILQFGAKVRDARKTNNVDDPAVRSTGAPALTMNQVLGSFSNPDFYSGHYPLGPLADLDQILAFIAANPSATEANDRQDSTKGLVQLRTSEEAGAGYMHEHDGHRPRSPAGRISCGGHTALPTPGYHVTLDSKGHYSRPARFPAVSDYTDVLPSVQYRFN